MVENKEFICEFCNLKIHYKQNYYRHKKYSCPIKLEQEKNKITLAQEELKKDYEKIKLELKLSIDKLNEQKELIDKQKDQNDNQKVKLEEQTKLINTQKEEIERQNKELLSILNDNRSFLQGTQKTSTSTISKSVDALTFLMTHRKNAPELKKITQENAQELLTRENKLYDYLLHYNSENKLDQYIGDIILKYIKKENPEDQSVWNSDVSRLTFLIRDIVNESPTWLRDPQWGNV